MNRDVIYPGIHAYKQAINEPQSIIDVVESNSPYVIPWYKWYDFGKQTLFTEYPYCRYESFPLLEQWSRTWETTTNQLSLTISKAFYECTSDYVGVEGVQAPNWVHGQPSLCMYASETPSQNLAMQYHTDFIMSETECPGFKHWLTCNIYLNDDYEGGELSFKVFTDDSNYKIIKYKPEAGDAVVFPSHAPYYHGVRRTTSGNKYFVRMFWGYEYKGSSQWLAAEEIYGKEVWAEMEKQRIDKENKSSMWMKGHIEEY